MVDKFWNFFRGSAPAMARARARPRRHGPGPPFAVGARFEAERGRCDVRSIARGARVDARARAKACRARWAWQGCSAGHVLGLSG